ncbi:hypothetical protein PROVRUST_08221 [Providencia rustigianii DSM 4541]|uniref:Uncharacterized protein n=1 Tax=Providencia rustigianii DSM 4541 TaxID=500637 RepID=D1P7K0_9GAMM|nr:hypothetical protein PROVRUST_08221 [Providencia rustigianii DSM 4541]
MQNTAPICFETFILSSLFFAIQYVEDKLNPKSEMTKHMDIIDIDNINNPNPSILNVLLK